MNDERTSGLARRAAIHAALADPARLQIADTLLAGDASPSELAAMLAIKLDDGGPVFYSQERVTRHGSGVPHPQAPHHGRGR